MTKTPDQKTPDQKTPYQKTPYQKTPYQKGARRVSRSPSLDEAVKIAKQNRGKNGIYGILQVTDGRIMEVGVYNGNSKRYVIFRSELVDENSLTEIREIIGQ